MRVKEPVTKVNMRTLREARGGRPLELAALLLVFVARNTNWSCLRRRLLTKVFLRTECNPTELPKRTYFMNYCSKSRSNLNCVKILNLYVHFIQRSLIKTHTCNYLTLPERAARVCVSMCVCTL